LFQQPHEPYAVPSLSFAPLNDFAVHDFAILPLPGARFRVLEKKARKREMKNEKSEMKHEKSPGREVHAPVLDRLHAFHSCRARRKGFYSPHS
jgi:hypothetical protein